MNGCRCCLFQRSKRNFPDEYRKCYHEMDKRIVEKHQNTSLEEAKALLQQSHEEMLRLAESFTEEELFTKGYYKVTYTTSMAAYFLSVTPYGQVVKTLNVSRLVKFSKFCSFAAWQ